MREGGCFADLGVLFKMSDIAFSGPRIVPIQARSTSFSMFPLKAVTSSADCHCATAVRERTCHSYPAQRGGEGTG